MPQPSADYMTEDEFYEFVQDRDEKWELIEGVPVMMAGANQRHQAIAANVFASLYNQLRGKRCRPTAADTGVSTNSGTVRYPDIVVDCGRRDDKSMVATEPTVVIEVLSPSTRGFDSHRKILEYKSRPDINCILLIDTNDACCLLHHRDGSGWSETMYTSLENIIEFPEIEAFLELSEIYFGIEMRPTLVRSVACTTCGSVPCTCYKNDRSHGM